MIALAAPQFDLDGAVILPTAEGRSRTAERSRRVVRTQTLDGSVSIVDRGYTDADRTLYLSQPSATLAMAEAVIYLLETYTRLCVSMSDGVYYVAPSNYTYTDGELTLTALVAQKVSA